MAWSRLQSASGNGGAATLAAAYGTNLTAGSKLIAYVVSSGGTGVTSVKDGAGNSFALVATSASFNGGSQYGYIYELDTPSGDAGTKPTITVTYSAANSNAVVIQEVSGLAAGTTAAVVLDGTPGTAAGTVSPVSSPSYASGAAGEYLVTFLGDIGNNNTYTAAGGWTLDANSVNTNGNACDIVQYKSSTGGTETDGLTFTGSGDQYAVILVAFKLAGTTVGAAALTGSGSMGGAWRFEAAAALTGSGGMGAVGTSGLLAVSALSGSGILGAAGTGGNVGAAAGLSGTGLLGAAGQVWLFQAALSGSGTLGAVGGATYAEAAGLSGAGLLSASVPTGWLAGSGTLGVTGEILGFAIGLSGFGTLSIPQVIGALTAGAGGASIPYSMPGSSQVAVAAPGSSNWQYLGTLGQVTALTYSYVCPGGCDQMTLTLMVPAAYRTQLLNPGWKVRITRGGHQVWDGKLDEPAPSAGGWTLTAVGTGNRGTDFLALYTDTWPAGQPDESVNQAISRGLPWVNPGVGAPAGMWLGQEIDPGAQTITALLNLVCTRGGLTWYVNSQPGGLYSGDDLTVFPLPTTPNRLLVATTPVARTLGGDVNTIVIRYQTAADNAATGAAATFAVTSVQNAQDVTAHQVTETYIDLSAAGTMSQAAAQAVGNSVLQVYQRASFAGPFTASYGQLLNTGGQPIDPGTDQAGTMVRLILTDFGYGGEVTPQFPVTFVVGAYEWDDFAQVASITPYQSLDESLTGMLSMESTVLTPITVAS